ncbi:molybdopterin-dependent oxidoreductase [Mycobacterium sp. LTG2003]
MASVDNSGPFKRDPPEPHEMRRRHTPPGDLIVLCHFGIPRITRDEWSLRIDGLVGNPRTITYGDLLNYPKVGVTMVHECCGSPFEPDVPTRRVANVTWSGARLGDVLTDCRPDAQARYVVSYGADSGAFAGVTADAYMKDLPLSRVDADVLLCYELNGAQLPAEHGFPVRLVVPGFYGTNSVKWLTRIELADRRPHGPFTTQWYQDRAVDDAGRVTGPPIPVWSIAPESLIVAPYPDQLVTRLAETEIWGWAWADDGVGEVDVRIGGGPWRSAQLERRRGWQWQRFRLPWTPAQPGTVEVAARAASTTGTRQPVYGRRNAIHRVEVTVR